MKIVNYIIAGIAVLALPVSCGRLAEFRVMSFNVWYDNPDDSPTTWDSRKAMAATAVPVWDHEIAGPYDF